MAKLIYNGKTILTEMKYLTSVYAISKGLMFSLKKKIDRGVCLVMPSSGDVRFGSSVTMMFCFYSMDIMFVNSKFEIVDIVTLKPWVFSYTPKGPAKYVIESSKNKFKNFKVGNKVKILID